MNIKQNIKTLTISLLVLISFSNYQLHAESLIYTVMKGDAKVGEFRIDKVTTKESTEFNSYSSVKVNMLLTIKVIDKMKVSYIGNRLHKAELFRTLNGMVRVKNSTTWNGKAYYMTNKDKEVTLLNQSIYHSTASLYYVEPTHIPFVFSESFQKMIPVKSIGQRKYILELPNGNKTSYTYTNGVCTLVEAKTDWAEIRFVLNKRIL